MSSEKAHNETYEFYESTTDKLDETRKKLVKQGWSWDGNRFLDEPGPKQKYGCRLTRYNPDLPDFVDEDEDEEEDDEVCYCPICREKIDLREDRFCKHLKFYIQDGCVEEYHKLSKKLDKWLSTHEIDGFQVFDEDRENLDYLLDKFNLEMESTSGCGLCCGPVSWARHYFFGGR